MSRLGAMGLALALATTGQALAGHVHLGHSLPPSEQQILSLLPDNPFYEQIMAEAPPRHHGGARAHALADGTLPNTGFWASARWQWMHAVAQGAENHFANHHHALMQPLWTDFLAHESQPPSVVTPGAHTAGVFGGESSSGLPSGPGTGGGLTFGMGTGSGGFPLFGTGAGGSDPPPGGGGIVMGTASVPEPSSMVLAASGLMGLTILGLLRRWRRS